MLLLHNTYKEQASLAMYCRTGDVSITGKVDKERVGNYRRLIINVVKDSLNAAYPLTRNLIEPEEWNSLIEQFFASYACKEPKIWRMPKELHTFVTKTKHKLLEKYFVLKELLWFEWLEIELYMQEDIHVNHTTEGKLHENKLIINPEHILKDFTYPIHLKKAEEIHKNEASRYYLSLHRHPKTGKVIFTNLSAALVRVVELLSESPLNINELTEKISEEFNIEDVISANEHILNFIKSAYKNKLIVGFSTK